jgi:hypothetical protein
MFASFFDDLGFIFWCWILVLAFGGSAILKAVLSAFFNSRK